MQLLNKNSTRFVIQFALILGLSFVVILAVDYLGIGSRQVPASVVEPSS